MTQVLHFSGLNGLRAIAALAVLFAHTTMSLDSFGLNSHFLGTNEDGNPTTTTLAGFGVSIFFSLSGFLITYLLLEEKKKGNINVKNFYIRRALRIWPLYYLYLFFSIGTLVLFAIPYERESVFFYVFMLANIPFIFGGAINFLGHYWSLGVEEQFYSFWPWVIKKSKSALIITSLICISLLILKFILRYIDLQTSRGTMSELYMFVHVTRFHCMLLGAIGAILYFEQNSLFIKTTNSLIAQLISWFIIILVTVNRFHILSFLDNEFISVVTVIIILGQIQKTNRVINLETSFFNFVGKISYGIYVIHPLVIFYLSKVISLSDKSDMFNYIFVYFLVSAVTLIVAYISYECYERRFLALKVNYTSVRNSDSFSPDPMK